jgi:hypothetical protein
MMKYRVRRSIAIIFHENEKKRTRNYVINYLADLWKAEGIDVTFVFGTKKVVLADLAILHVNLSVVPDEYLEYAREYPKTLNGQISDIRKSTFSKSIVRPGDDYDGKVFVKSDLNYAGIPERDLNLSSVSTVFRRIRKSLPRPGRFTRTSPPFFNSPSDYLILDSPDLVPQEWYERKDIVIEKFLPEIDDQGRYCVRNYNFLGDRYTCLRRYGMDPVVNGSSAIGMEQVPVHPEIVALRTKMKFDYGKFDYVLRGDSPVLLDVNKTPGTAPAAQVIPSLRLEWAAGIHSYLTDFG